MRKFPLLLLFALFAVGCGTSSAQVKPTNYVVDLSWTQPAANGSWTGCTTAAPCSYVISRIQLAAGTTTCPAPDYATPNYTPLNQGSPATGLTYTDTSASGLVVCYVAQTQQSGLTSYASNTAGPFTVPVGPNMPGTLSGTGQAAKLEMPQDSHAPVLMAKLATP